VSHGSRPKHGSAAEWAGWTIAYPKFRLGGPRCIWFPNNWSVCSLILSKIGATSCQILRIKCTKFAFRWCSGSDPTGGAFSALPDSLAVGPIYNRPTSNGRAEKQMEGERGREGKVKGREGKRRRRGIWLTQKFWHGAPMGPGHLFPVHSKNYDTKTQLNSIKKLFYTSDFKWLSSIVDMNKQNRLITYFFIQTSHRPSSCHRHRLRYQCRIIIAAENHGPWYRASSKLQAPT